jgi:hypothetical protein
MNVYLNNEDGNEIIKNRDIETKQSLLLKKQYDIVKYQILCLSVISGLTFATVIYYSYRTLVAGLMDTKVFINILVILIGYFSYLIKISKIFPQLFVE